MDMVFSLWNSFHLSATVSPGNPPPITYNTPGTYYVTCVVKNSFGEDSVTVPNVIQVLANPAVTITPPSGGICDVSAGQAFDTVYFSATYSPSYIYSWAPGGSLSYNTCPNPQAFPAVTTVYTLTVTGPGGCTTTLTDTVIAWTIIAKITGKDSICAGSEDTLIASGGSQNTPPGSEKPHLRLL
jgi:PKD repeat protein